MSYCAILPQTGTEGNIEVLQKPKQQTVSGVHTTPRGAHEGEGTETARKTVCVTRKIWNFFLAVVGD